jgi:hypothetical protein
MPTIQSDFIQSFNAIASDVHEIAKEKGWWDVQTAEEYLKSAERVNQGIWSENDIKTAYEQGQQNPPPNPAKKIALMHPNFPKHWKDCGNQGQPEFTKEEVKYADEIIRIMDKAKKDGLRVPEALIAKVSYNKTCEHKHGGKKF